MNRIPVKVDRVIDGDTFHSNEVEVAIFDVTVKIPDLRFRLLGVDTPERNEQGYKEATAFTKNLIQGKEVIVQPTGKDVFGRWLCVVYLEDEKTLNDLLLESKNAVVYER